MMRLLIDGAVFGWQKRGGISRIYEQVLPRVLQLESDLDISVVVQGPLPSRVLDDIPVTVERIPHIPGTWKPWRLWSRLAPHIDDALAGRHWRGCRADVFHPTYYTTPMAATPAFCFVYDMLFELFPECFDAGTGDRAREQKHRAIRSAHRVLCISENTKKDVVKILDIEPTKCDVVYLAGLRRTEEGNRGETELKKRPFFLYVGDYEAPYKNFEFLLDCLGQPGFSEFGEHELVVAAPDFPEASKLKRYHELLPDTRLTFLNRCDDKMLTDLYISCNALVVPSLYEGFGLPVVEALGCGTPVVCSNVSSLPEVGGETAYYFDPQSVAEFRAALERGVRDGRTREHVDRRVERASCFSWDRTARSFALAARKTAGSV